jgi:hypothetical protein
MYSLCTDYTSNNQDQSPSEYEQETKNNDIAQHAAIYDPIPNSAAAQLKRIRQEHMCSRDTGSQVMAYSGLAMASVFLMPVYSIQG